MLVLSKLFYKAISLIINPSFLYFLLHKTLQTRLLWSCPLDTAFNIGSNYNIRQFTNKGKHKTQVNNNNNNNNNNDNDNNNKRFLYSA